MRTLTLILAGALLAAPAAYADSMNKNGDTKTTGAMGNATSNGVATDPAGVKAQQGRSSNASPGTVGAAPGADTQSQHPAGKSK